MSAGSSGKREGAYVMPEKFSFGLEERKAPELEPEMAPIETAPAKTAEASSTPVCQHKWEALPDAQQTLAGEGKTIWRCLNCGNKTNTYSWDKP
jgi:DNA-directed RNA polymerase subunit M/transcription elongation factor TFIIS